MIWFQIQVLNVCFNPLGTDFERVDLRFLPQTKVLAVRAVGAETLAALHFAIHQKIARFPLSAQYNWRE